MLPLLLFLYEFVFLVLGAIAFAVCFTTPRLRKFALSAALWFVVLGLCVVACVMLAGLGFITQQLLRDHLAATNHALQALPKLWGRTFLIFTILGSAALSSLVAYGHQIVVRRLTFPLFRLYATVVVAGIGSVFGWLLNFVMLGNFVMEGHVFLWLVAMVLLILGFGAAGYRWARMLRGQAPTQATWLSAEEFNGDAREA